MTVCNECNVSIESGEYCDLCVSHMVESNKGDSMIKAKERMHAQRNKLIAELYGEDAVLKNELMFNERNTGSIAFEATKCGRNLDDVLTRPEAEDLMRETREYEMCDHDLIEYGARQAQVYTTSQIRDFIQGRDKPVSVEVQEVLDTEVREYKTYIPQVQKELNLAYYTNKIKNARKASTIGWIGKMVFDAIKGSERTFTITEDGEDKEITVPTFLPKGTYKDFWAFYKKAKEDIAARAITTTNGYETSYNKVVDIVNKATLKDNKDNQLDVISYELSLMDSQSLWDSLKYAKNSGRRFAYPVYLQIVNNAKANKGA